VEAGALPLVVLSRLPMALRAPNAALSRIEVGVIEPIVDGIRVLCAFAE
jgi:hypothetical protein